MDDSISNRRRFPRIDDRLKFKLRDRATGWTEDTVNISAGGLRFRTDVEQRVGDVIGVDIIKGGPGVPNTYLRVTGKVVRVIERSGMFEVAIEYTDMNEDLKKAFERFVHRKA
ncbi:MAG TPA: PilZ domain-containing protein [Dissulfurispiraceae bacterium]|nr:PilZ domain-containing protein [Dissulfurispiraceae bacterium]